METMLKTYPGLATVLLTLYLTVASHGQSQPIVPVEGSSTNLADLSIEQLMRLEVATVYGASKHDQKVTMAPASVSIVTSDEIKKFGYRDFADVLRSVRGLYVANDRNYQYLGVRGFLRPGDYNTRVLVLMDGHRMNDNVYDSTYFGREIDIDLIDRVEVIRGPSSSVYGSSAFFGVINIVTKRGAAIDGVEVSGEAGGFGAYKTRFSVGKHFTNEVDVLLSGSYLSIDGPGQLYFPEFDQRISTEPRARQNGMATNRDGEEVFNFQNRIGYRDLTLSGLYSSRIKDVPTASYGTLFNDGRERTTDERAYVDVTLDHAFSEELSLLGRGFYDRYQYSGTYPYDYADPGDPPDLVLNKDGAVGEWAGTEWQLTGRLFDRHTLLGGAEYRENLSQEQFAFDETTPRTYTLNDHRTSRNLGLYAQSELSLRSDLVLNTGLRFDDYFEGFGSTLNPRLGLIYSPWTTTSFKALYGQAYRAPNPYERFYNPAQSTRDELQPERIRTYELVLEQYVGQNYRLSLSGYRYEVDDLITQTTTPAGELLFDNLEQAVAHGVEFEAEGKFESGFLVRASYALQRAEDAETGLELTSSPRHLAKLNLISPLYRDKLFAGLEMQYHSVVRTLAGSQTDDFLIANFTLLAQRLMDGLELSASVYNLLDTQYAYPGAEDHLQDVLVQDGRSFRVKLTYRF